MRRLIRTFLLGAGVAGAGCGGGADAGGARGAWREFTLPNTFDVTAVWAFAPDDVWAGGPGMLHFDGTAFAAVSAPPIGRVADFVGFAPNDLYAVADASLLHWDGAVWSTIDFGGAVAPTDLLSIWGTSRNDLWLGDSLNGQVHRWNGTTWTTALTRAVEVVDLWGSSGDDVYAAGLFGMSHFNGSAWTEVSGTEVEQATGVWGFGAADVWAVGDFGTLAHWDGATWTDKLPVDDNQFEEEDHVAVWGSAPNNLWAAGSFGAISRWDGARWTQVQYGVFPYFPFLNKVQGSSAEDVWVVGRTTDGTNTGILLHHGPIGR